MKKNNLHHAVVSGGSISGLLSAQVLSSFFDQVTICERFDFQKDDELKKGSPQGAHMHHLWNKGITIIENLLPGFQKALRKEGAIPITWKHPEVTIPMYGTTGDFDCGLETYDCSRALLEKVIVDLVLANPKIKKMPHTKIIGLQKNEISPIANGVILVNEEKREMLSADLIVDAGGRGSALPEWLGKCGILGPEETIVDAKMVYVSRMYEIPHDFKGPYQKILHFLTPATDPRNGALMRIEKNRWMVTLGGLAGVYPPMDEAGFLEFAKNLPDPILFHTIKNAKPLTDLYSYRGGKNRWRHYEKGKFLDNVIAIGDAFLCVNPLSGHGMSLAAMGAETLNSTLKKVQTKDDPLNNFGFLFHRQLAKKLRLVWDFNKNADLQWIQDRDNKPSWRDRFLSAYIREVYRVGAKNFRIKSRIITCFTHLHIKLGPFFSPQVLFLTLVSFVKRKVRARFS